MQAEACIGIHYTDVVPFDLSLKKTFTLSFMIAQSDNKCISLSLIVLFMDRVPFSAVVEYFKGFYPGWSPSSNLSGASVSENDSISPQRHHTTCGHGERRSMSNHGQIIAEKNKMMMTPCLVLMFLSVFFSAGFQIVPAILHWILLIPCPESPAYLFMIKKDRALARAGQYRALTRAGLYRALARAGLYRALTRAGQYRALARAGQ